MTVRRPTIVLCAALSASLPSKAAEVIEDVRLAKQGEVATLDIELACPIRYVDHAPAFGLEVSVRIELSDECFAAIGGGIRSELREPSRSTVAAVRQIIFDTRGDDDATVVVRVMPSQQFTVSQGRARNVVHVELRPTPANTVAAEVIPRIEPAAPPPNRPVVTVDTPRQPLRLVQSPTQPRERYALQVRAAADVSGEADALAATAANRIVYVNDYAEGDERRQELRLGFFDSERDARDAAARLPAPFTGAVVVVANTDEQNHAASARLLTDASPEPTRTDPTPRAPSTLSPERIEVLATEANEAMLAGAHDRAIQLYSRLLEEPAFSGRREARERIGIAHERQRRSAQARLAYQELLAEFPEGSEADRVRQRLASLVAAVAPPAARAPTSPQHLWDFRGGAAQYLRYDEFDSPGQDAETDEHSRLLTDVNLVARRHGERFALVQRLDAAYQRDLVETEDEDAIDQLQVTNAYIDLTDSRRAWQARVGRQSVYGSGILGRFDGAHVDYQWRPDIALNLAIGHPVDHPRQALDTRRRFVGFSADLDDLARDWDFTFFGVLQQVDGIADREAVGAEARYRNERWHVIAAADADVSYAVLNSALVNAAWRPTDRLTLNGRFNFGAGPFIATRNALTGQPAVTIERMLGTYTEAQLRGIARDRTAQIEQGTVGLSRPVLDRFQLKADVGYYRFEGTVGSAGIVGLPATASQTFFNTSVVGSSLFKSGDTAVFGFRHAATHNTTNDTLTFDVRLPTTEKLRVNPRLSVSSRRYTDGGSTQRTLMPALRVLWRSPKRHQFELDLGMRLSTREFSILDVVMASPDEEFAEKFIYAGYWWELR